jgi:hypothetical protein
VEIVARAAETEIGRVAFTRSLSIWELYIKIIREKRREVGKRKSGRP